jgi:hypothetical protein
MKVSLLDIARPAKQKGNVITFLNTIIHVKQFNQAPQRISKSCRKFEMSLFWKTMV